ncbi:hypothetical protein BDV12DRAFT_198059 [Aspergillus spectabilis]
MGGEHSRPFWVNAQQAAPQRYLLIITTLPTFALSPQRRHFLFLNEIQAAAYFKSPSTGSGLAPAQHESVRVYYWRFHKGRPILPPMETLFRVLEPENYYLVKVCWFHSIPIQKQDLVHADGSADEMMFQAYLLAHCSMIYLHMPQFGLLAPFSYVLELICGS